jgi:hypothetical protein
VPDIRITFVHIALLINRPTEAIVILPFDEHSAELVLPDGRLIPLANGRDIRLEKNGRPFAGAPTRASSEYVVHLDHVFGKIVTPNETLVRNDPPKNINARIFLAGGRLEGLPCAKFIELQNVVWKFTEHKSGRVRHQQKLTDALRYTVSVEPGGDYAVSVSGQRYTFTVAASDNDFVIKNNDRCREFPKGPNYVLTEYSSLYALTSAGAKPGHPLPEATPGGFFVSPTLTLGPRTQRGRKKADNKQSCSAVCGNAQIL